MTPVETLRQYAQWADQERPDLRIINTKPSCFELLALTLKKAGAAYAFIGKTATMDGDGKYTPSGFTPFDIELHRDDGELQTVRITAVSMDAAWHLPTMRQIKVIVNSTANEPGPHTHGPASLGCYEIEPVKDGVRQYRWHNPPIAQFLLGTTPDPPVVIPPTSPPPVKPTYPSYEALGGDEGGKKITRILEADYKRAGMRGLDGDCGAWQQRVSYDFLTGLCKTVEESIAKHRREWCDTLGIDVI